MERSFAEYLSHAPIFVRRFDGEIVYWTAGAEELYGYTAVEAVGRRSHQLLNTRFPKPLEAIEQELQELGCWEGRLEHTAKDGREIWTESLWRCRDPTLVVEQNTDVTRRVLLERHRDLLALELDHRVKNTLAVVQGLAHLTFNGAAPTAVAQFDGRLIALSRAHDLLRRHQWEAASLKDLIGAVTEPLDVDRRIALEGPDVPLGPTAVVAYGLAFHELCTNALKYGALKIPEGRVSIHWSLQDGPEQRIHLTWREHGGPKVQSPRQEGFGSRLIRAAVAGELGTPVSFHFEEDGLVCEFDGPVEKAPNLP
jgi:two-component system CheB/CheR fusion protein